MAKLNVRIAQELIEAHDLTAEKLWTPWETSTLDGSKKLVHSFWPSDELWNIVRQKVNRLRPETLARVVWYSQESGYDLYTIHCGTWLGKYDDGRTLMRDIAATTILATIRSLVPEPVVATV